MQLNRILILFSTILFINCSTSKEIENQECKSTSKAFVTKVNGPEQTQINKAITLAISFPVMNGCGQFNKLSERVSGKTTTIEIEAIYKGCYCTMDIPIRTANYTFKATEAGKYILRFKSSETEFLEKIIMVK